MNYRHRLPDLGDSHGDSAGAVPVLDPHAGHPHLQPLMVHRHQDLQDASGQLRLLLALLRVRRRLCVRVRLHLHLSAGDERKILSGNSDWIPWLSTNQVQGFLLTWWAEHKHIKSFTYTSFSCLMAVVTILVRLCKFYFMQMPFMPVKFVNLFLCIIRANIYTQIKSISILILNIHYSLHTFFGSLFFVLILTITWLIFLRM